MRNDSRFISFFPCADDWKAGTVETSFRFVPAPLISLLYFFCSFNPSNFQGGVANPTVTVSLVDGRIGRLGTSCLVGLIEILGAPIHESDFRSPWPGTSGETFVVSSVLRGPFLTFQSPLPNDFAPPFSPGRYQRLSR